MWTELSEGVAELFRDAQEPLAQRALTFWERRHSTRRAQRRASEAEQRRFEAKLRLPPWPPLALRAPLLFACSVCGLHFGTRAGCRIHRALAHEVRR